MHELSSISPVWGRLTDLVVRSGEGCWVESVSGDKYLDFTSGIGVTNTGHCHPRVVEAIREQAGAIIHAQVNCYFHEPLMRATAALRTIVPDHLNGFFLSNSGAEAVEAAVKLARHHTRRTNIVVFQGGFHGRTAQTMAMTTAKTSYRLHYQPLPGGVFVAPFPVVYRSGLSEEEASEAALDQLRLLLQTQTAPSETAAFVIEPVLGEGGYIPAPDPFLRGLEQVAREHGILLVADEVQSGFGRTGTAFAHQRAGVSPDIMVMAKGMGSGFPISGIAAPQSLMDDWIVGSHGGTYGGNPIGCAAVEATVGVIQDEQLIDNARSRGEQLSAGLRELAERDPRIGDVRGRGLMVGCEFTDPASGRPDAETAKRVVTAAREQEKLLLLTCGPWGNVIRWIPPLIVTQDQIQEALGRFESALRSACQA